MKKRAIATGDCKNKSTRCFLYIEKSGEKTLLKGKEKWDINI